MRRTGVLIWILWMGLFGFTSCTDRLEEVEEQYTGENEVWVRLIVSRPYSGKEVRSKAGNDRETEIDEIQLLVFEEGGYKYRVPGISITNSGTTTSFSARLLATDKTLDLYIVANATAAVLANEPQVGDTENEVRTKLQLGFPLGGNFTTLPMSGHYRLVSGLDANYRQEISGVSMLRAVARVDVLVGGITNFELTSIQAYRVNSRIQLIANQDLPVVTAPSIPVNSRMEVNTPVSAVSGNQAVSGLYLSESVSPAESERVNGATCVVVGGKYAGSGEVTYYRIDFDPDDTQGSFGQILRNYRYVFRIRKVTGPGWSDPALAAVNRATGIVAEIRPWENFTTEMYFEGDNYFGLSSRNVTLDYQAGRVDTVDVQTTVPYAIQWLDTSGTPVGSAVSGVGASLPDNGGFTVAIARNSDDAETVTRLIFTTTGDNRTQSEATAGLRITAGRWTLDVSVKQESPEKYRKRFIRVLSVTEVGSFGTNNPAAASGQPLRRILDNAKNFSPSGTVIVGGFSFTEASRAEIQATSTGSGSDIFQNVKNTINTQDVIYLTYNSPISDELAKVVLSWLRSSPNRVLIVGTDTDATNANLRSYLTADGTWKYYNQSPAVGGKFKRAAQTDGNRRFFTSPFGTVAENAPIARADDYAGYCLNYPAGVTPLVVSDAVGYEKAMIVGVNRQDRIVYHGDANLNQNGRLSSQANANGSVTSDFDRLTANLWAWIVEQVCEQE